MKLQPAGSGGAHSARRPAVFYGPPGYLRWRDKIRGLAEYQRVARERADEAYEESAAELGAPAADLNLSRFLEKVHHRRAHRLQGWLKDYVELRLWESPQREIYDRMVEHDYFGDFPQQFTRELMKEIPGVPLAQRVKTFEGFLGNEPFRHHDTKEKAYAAIKSLHRQGWDWSRASDCLIELAHRVPPGEHGQYWNGAHLVGDFISQKLYKPERAQRYLALQELGFHRDGPAKMMALLDSSVAQTTAEQRTEAFCALTEANKPVWFEEPKKVVLAFQSWCRRVEAGGEPERCLKKACELSRRLGKQVAEDAEPTFHAFALLRDPVSNEGWQELLATPGALESLTEPMLSLNYRDRPEAATQHRRLLEHFVEIPERLDISKRFDAFLRAGDSPEQAADKLLRGVVGDADTGPGPEIEYEPGYLMIGEHGLPVDS